MLGFSLAINKLVLIVIFLIVLVACFYLLCVLLAVQPIRTMPILSRTLPEVYPFPCTFVGATSMVISNTIRVSSPLIILIFFGIFFREGRFNHFSSPKTRP